MQRIAGRIMLLDGWRRLVVAFLAGAVATFALAPFNVPLAGFLAFPVLVWLIDGAAPEPGSGALRRGAPAFLVGWTFGFGYFVAGLWWLGAAILVDAEAFLWALPFAVLGLPAVLAIYYGLAAVLARALWSDGAGRILALAASLALAETLRATLFTGFAWNEIGMMAAPVPSMMQSLALVGLHALTLAAIVVFCAPAAFTGSAAWRRPVLGLALFLAIAHLGYGAYRLAEPVPERTETVALRIVQPNVLQAQKWEPAEAERIFAELLALSTAPAATLEGTPTVVVWPETAFPFLLTQRPDAVLRLAETFRPGETLLAGATRMEDGGDGNRRFYNSVLLIDETGTIVSARDKVHLVPFGEYLPFQEQLESLGIEQLTQLPGGFSAGSDRSPIDLGGRIRALALICYEVIFQDGIDPDASPERPELILNVTNDAWYGRTPGPYQHLAHARATAVTFGLPLVRAANSGVSFVSDAHGRERASLPLATQGTIETVFPAAGAATPFSRHGNLPFAVLLVLAFAAALASCIAGNRRTH